MHLTLPTITALLFAFALKPVAGAEATRPNILFVYVDDLGWGSIGPNGQAKRKGSGLPYVRTPNLNRLAASGVNFTRGYGCTVCSPARSSLQTGFHQGHTFADRNDPDNAKKAIRADDVSIGTALSSVGYVTGYWGKWGYGGSKDPIMPVIVNEQTLPGSHGYEYVLAELHHVRAHTFFQPTLWSSMTARTAGGGLRLVPNTLSRYQRDSAWPDTPALQNHPDYPKTAYCDDAYAFAALDFVRTQAQNYNRTGTPFFGLLAVQIPHAPFSEITTLPEWDSAYADDPHFASLSGQTRQWAAMVTRLDAHLGNLLAALDDPNHDGDTSDSVADNTLVVFQSDNGGPAGRNSRELNANGGLSGHKGRIQEGGIRVPLIMRWPARIRTDTKLQAGTSCNRVVDVTDLLPTFCELGGAVPPVGIDGVSIAATLTGAGHQRVRDFVIHEAANGQSIIRGKYKLVRSKKSQRSLFDLEADPAEEFDVSENHPRLVAELETLLLAERVTEPRGFANTYHRWIGDSGGQTSNPDHWSDYTYSNAGTTYLTDRGAPRPSWIAHIINTSPQPQTAIADSDLNVLGIEIRGDFSSGAVQTLKLGPQINLTGRNEIRLAAHSALTIDGGHVKSLRWVDIRPQAVLQGHGVVNGTVYNFGSVSITGADLPQLSVHGDYHQAAAAVLSIRIGRQGQTFLQVSDEVRLNGKLTVDASGRPRPEAGETFLAVTGRKVKGRFSNTNNEVVCSDGVRYAIGYSQSAVTLTVQ